MNRLTFGDNLDVLRRRVKDESVDLVYLDPPFNSNSAYNLIHRSPVGDAVDAQKRVFKDTWRWEEDAASVAMEDVRTADLDLFRILQSLQGSLGTTDLMAYLAMMAVRLLELRRVLKPTGSLYLHCDPTASHYLKVLLDGVFGSANFLSEISWKRTGSHSSARRWGPVHDVLLYYAKENGRHVWNRPYVPLSEKHLASHYRKVDSYGRRYEHGELTGPGTRNGRSGAVWKGFDVTSIGRHWTTTVEKLDELHQKGRIYLPLDGGWPRLIRYEDEAKGRAVGDVWDDIPPVNMRAKERLGYPTQKPLALLERLIEASSNTGDVVLDPFCGCGTTIHAAEKLNRAWVGIDVAYDAILVIQDRLKSWLPAAVYKVDGIPTADREARALAQLEPHTFQEWAVGRLGGRCRGRGADRGIDGEIAYLSGRETYGRAIISVKAGRHVNPGMIRDLAGVVQREGAQAGIFVCVNEPTREMRLEAQRSELVDLPGGRRHRIQIVTAEGLIDGPDVAIPTALNTITAAEHARAAARKKPPRRPTAEELRRAPPLPPMGIPGSSAASKPEVPLPVPIDEPLVATPRERPTRRRRS